MYTRTAVSSLGIIALVLLLMSAKADAMALNVCNRHTVGFFSLAAELQNVYWCNRAVCNGADVDFEVKQISGYNTTTNPWLVNTIDTSTQYTPSQQNAIIQNAYILANANKPAFKHVSNIQFFWTLTVPVGTPAYLIGANATYARCINVPLPN
jgi:hypothetical protein